LSDIIEVFLDSQTENKFVKGLPVVGLVMKSVGVVDKIKTKFLVNKILFFIKGISNISEDELHSFESKYLSNPRSIEKFCETLLISIDRLSHLDKSEIISSLFKSLIRGKINNSSFLDWSILWKVFLLKI
jgi:hypothetical protein